MYYTLATKMVVASSTSGYSQAVSMEGANAARYDLTIFNLGGAASLQVIMEGSNDLQNWATLESFSAHTTLGAFTDDTTAISYAHVRLKFTAGASGTGPIFACGLNTTHL